FESGKLERNRKEAWINNLEVVVEESASMASKKRKNRDKVIIALEATPRMAYD
ncbi:hypothetical protein CU098_006804, partial [Rhizopus stolonifer]